MKSHREIFEHLIKGGAVKRKIGGLPVKMGASGDARFPNGTLVAFTYPEIWEVYEEKKTYTMYRQWFLDMDGALHYYDDNEKPDGNLKSVDCTCCQLNLVIETALEYEVIKEIVI